MQTPHAAPTSNSVAPMQPCPEPAVVPLQPTLLVFITARHANTPAGAAQRQLTLPLSLTHTQAPYSKGFQQPHLRTGFAFLRLREVSLTRFSNQRCERGRPQFNEVFSSRVFG